MMKKSFDNLKTSMSGSTRAASSSQSRVTTINSPKTSTTRQEKIEITTDVKSSRLLERRQEKPVSASQTLTSGMNSPKTTLKIKLTNEKRGSSERNHSRSSQQSLSSTSVSTATTIKVSESINLRESMRADSKKGKRPGLEINTDLTNAKYSPVYAGPVTTVAKSQTTKHKDLNETSEGSVKKNPISNSSFEFNSKFSNKLIKNDAQEKPKSSMVNSQLLLRNSPTQRSQTLEDEEGGSQRNSLTKSGILHKLFSQQGQQKSPTATSMQKSRNETPQESATRSRKTLKFNNYFSGAQENSKPQTTKGPQSQNRLDTEEEHNVYGQDSKSQSLKKTGSKTNGDLKQALRQVYNEIRSGTQQIDLPKETKTTTAKEQMKNSGKFFKDAGNQNGQHQTEKVEKVSLQSFVTKVSKGSMFSPGVQVNTKTEPESIERPAKKSVPNIEDTFHQQKTTKTIPSKTPKTTTNSEGRVFVFGSAESKQASNMRSSQEIKGASQKNLKSSGIVPKTTKNEIVSTQKTALTTKNSQVTPFIYYVTSLEKHHRNYSERDYFCQIFREHFNQTYQAMMFVKYLKPVDSSTLSSKKVNLARRPGYEGKRTIVFDMDETLIHCNETIDMPYHVKLPIVFPQGEVIEAGINIRPYAIEALKELSQHFEIIVFTASHACYANVVLDYLDPKKQYVHHRLFRDSCIQTDEGVYVKDLRVIANRNLSDMVLVDNAAYSFAYQLDNGIPIAPYYDHPDDEELKHLVPYLKFLNYVEDMKAINRQTFKLHMYSMHESIEEALENIVLSK